MMKLFKGNLPKGAFLSAVLASTMLLAGCPKPEPSIDGCRITDEQKILLNVDTQNFGTFESYSVQGDQVVFRNGIIPPTPFLEEWIEHNRKNPDLPRFHDFRIFAVKNKYIAEGLAAMLGVKILDYKGKAVFSVGKNEYSVGFTRKDKKNSLMTPGTRCVIIEELKVSAEEIGPYEGTITLFGPKKKSDLKQ